MQIYILSNCDTCRKTLKWFEQSSIKFDVFDIRQDGIDKNIIHAAISALGWGKVLNRRSTSWRSLSEAQRADLTADRAAELIIANPTLMKRPLFVINGQFAVGFDDASRRMILQAAIQ